MDRGPIHKIRKPQIARVLDRNRKQILKDIGARGRQLERSMARPVEDARRLEFHSPEVL
jgi:hypothetical protein